METALLIEKEIVDSLKFPLEEVLIEPATIEQRAKALKKALSLGNLNKLKVEIIFEDDEGLKMVNTTIWAITEKNIVLKAGRYIPRNRVHRIELL